MRVATLLFTVLAAASTVTFAAPVPAQAPAPVPGSVATTTPVLSAAPVLIPPIQDLQNRSLWGSIKKAASGAARFVSNAANKVKGVYNAASNLYKSASSAFRSASNVYNQVPPLVKAIHKREDEFEGQLHRRDELEFEKELHRRDEMEVEERLSRRHIENTESDNAPTMRKLGGGDSHARHHRD